jgi:hypothetical protein
MEEERGEMRCDVCGRKFTMQNIVPAAFAIRAEFGMKWSIRPRLHEISDRNAIASTTSAQCSAGTLVVGVAWPFMNVEIRSSGMGKMTVVLFSMPISTNVWRNRICIAIG